MRLASRRNPTPLAGLTAAAAMTRVARWLCVALLALLVSAGSASAVEVASWDLDAGTIDSATPYPATGSDIDTEAGALSLAPALTPKVATNRFVAAGWGVNPFPEPDFYLEFTVAPLAGREILFTSLEAKLASASGLHDLGYELRSSVDCYASVLDDGEVAIDGTETVALDLFSMSAQGGATTFRLYIRDIDMIGEEIGVAAISVFGQPVSGGTSPFVRVTPIEFCSVSEDRIDVLSSDGSHVYGMQYNAAGGQLWRSPDRLSWEAIGPPGLGNPDNEAILLAGNPDTGFVRLDGLVYAGTINGATGGEIYRSSDLLSWTAVMTGGFGDPVNFSISPELVHDGYLYAGATRITGGAAIWRSADGISWDKTSPDGFGDPDTTSVRPRFSFNGAIYALAEQSASAGGGQSLFRSFDGVTWVEVLDGSAINPLAPSVPTAVFDGYLYMKHLRSVDGTTWDPVPFGAPPCGSNPSSIYAAMSFGNAMYVLCYGGGDPSGYWVTEIWGTNNGTWWTPIAHRAPSPEILDALVTSLSEFDGRLLISTVNLIGSPSPVASNRAIWSATPPALPVPAFDVTGLVALTVALGAIGAGRSRRTQVARSVANAPTAPAVV